METIYKTTAQLVEGNTEVTQQIDLSHPFTCLSQELENTGVCSQLGTAATDKQEYSPGGNKEDEHVDQRQNRVLSECQRSGRIKDSYAKEDWRLVHFISSHSVCHLIPSHNRGTCYNR